ncbi:MAG: type IV secretion protein IcmS [Gammaproteobacteria bacterium]|nr:type IV secretion protein IcmS [Gammaproteobacteria bacterium]
MLIKMVTPLGASYTLKGTPISLSEIFADTGLLPAIARRADQLLSLCLGYGIGVTFEDVGGSLLGKKVKFDDMTPEVFRYLCTIDVMNELIKAAPSKDAVVLDELLYDES